MAQQAEGLLRSPGRQLLLCADAASSSKRLKVVEDSGGASLPDGPDGHDELKALKKGFADCEKALKFMRKDMLTMREMMDNMFDHVKFLCEGERERRRSSSSSAAEAPSAAEEPE